MLTKLGEIPFDFPLFFLIYFSSKVAGIVRHKDGSVWLVHAAILAKARDN